MQGNVYHTKNKCVCKKTEIWSRMKKTNKSKIVYFGSFSHPKPFSRKAQHFQKFF